MTDIQGIEHYLIDFTKTPGGARAVLPKLASTDWVSGETLSVQTDASWFFENTEVTPVTQSMVRDEIAAQVKAVVTALRQEIQESLDARPVAVPACLSDLASDSYRLTTSVPIVIEQYEDEVAARWPEVEAFGAGDTESLALAALRQDIVDLYLDLRETPDAQLGHNAQTIKRILMRVVDGGNE